MSESTLQTFPETARSEYLEYVESSYKMYREAGIIGLPQCLYGKLKENLFRVDVEGCPEFAENAEVGLSSGRTAFLSVDIQRDFCGEEGYVDTMGCDFSRPRRVLYPIPFILELVRDIDIDAVERGVE